ncbi:MAG: SDR family NAD(P)-dependent oxidoreductase [Bacteriovoracaceae bacterium]|nr:SDR family NAD(P)-dependent oxidoreductase [Bacteriovoracaceae bacterium]
MAIKLKPLYEQVIFITGATSSIGPAIVHRAVEQSAKVFMVDRNEEELQDIQNEMRQKGYETDFFVADVADEDQLQRAAAKCMVNFGRIDTFINNSSGNRVGEEAKRQFDVNFWGLVNGCKVALPLMQDEGGVIMNIGRVNENQALPIQGIYEASKHAVKGYTDALRRELTADRVPIQVTLVMPSDEDTLYDVDVAAQAILKCAVRPVRELRLGRIFPKLKNYLLSRGHKEATEGHLLAPTDHPGLIKWSAFAGGLGFLFIMKLRKLRSF